MLQVEPPTFFSGGGGGGGEGERFFIYFLYKVLGKKLENEFPSVFFVLHSTTFLLRYQSSFFDKSTNTFVV